MPAEKSKTICDLCFKPVTNAHLRRHKGGKQCLRNQRSIRATCQSKGCDKKSKCGHWDALTGEYIYTRCDDHSSEINNTANRGIGKRRSPTKFSSKSRVYFLRFLIFCSHNHLKMISSHWYIRWKLNENKPCFCKPKMECTICGHVSSTTCIPSILNYARGCKCASNTRKWSSKEKMDEYFDKCKRDKRGIICMVKDYAEWKSMNLKTKSRVPMKHVGTPDNPGCNKVVMIQLCEYNNNGYFGCSCFDSNKRLVNSRYDEFVQKASDHTAHPDGLDILTSKEAWENTMVNAHCKPLVQCRRCKTKSECSTIASLFMLKCGFDCKCSQWRTQTLMQIVVSEFLPDYEFNSVRPDFLRNEDGKDGRNNLEYDWYCEELNLAFEYNGKQHYVAIPHFSKGNMNKANKKLEGYKKHDLLKLRRSEEKGIYLIVCPWNGFDGDPTKPIRENKTKLSITPNMMAYVKFRLEKWKKDTGNTVQLKDITTLSSDAFKQWRQNEDNKKSLRKKKEERAKNMCKATTANGKPCPNQCRAEKDFCGMHLPGSMRTKEVDDLEDVKDCPSRRSMYVEGGKYCTITGTVFEWRNGKFGCTKCDYANAGCGNLASHKKNNHHIEKLDMKRKETKECTACHKETPKTDFTKRSGKCSQCRHAAYRKKNPKRKTCRCGSTTHMRTVNMNCPLNSSRGHMAAHKKTQKCSNLIVAV